MENPKTQNKMESKPKSNLNLSSKKTQYKVIFHIQIFKKKNGEKCTGAGSTNRSIAKKCQIARHGGSSSEYWKPGIHINNIPAIGSGYSALRIIVVLRIEIDSGYRRLIGSLIGWFFLFFFFEAIWWA